MKKWLVFYTKSRQEKKVKDWLEKSGYDVFFPTQKVMRQWSDRKKKVEMPLFHSYLFVHESEDKIPLLLQTPGIAWNIRYNGKPAILSPREYDLIQRFLLSGLFIEVTEQQPVQLGDHVQVIDGPLKGIEGHLIKQTTGNRFVLSLHSFSSSMLVELDPLVLKKTPHFNE